MTRLTTGSWWIRSKKADSRSTSWKLRARALARSAEPVDVHLLDPVAQRVQDQGQHLGVAGVQGVAGAGVVHVEAPVGVDRPVVGVVVEAPERQRRAHVVALGGVVVDDVQDHLDPAACRLRTIALNSLTCWPLVPVEE